MRSIFPSKFAVPVLRLPKALVNLPALRLLAALDADMVQSIVESAAATVTQELGAAAASATTSAVPLPSSSGALLINLRELVPPLSLFLPLAEPLRPQSVVTPVSSSIASPMRASAEAHSVVGAGIGPGIPVAPVGAVRSSGGIKQDGLGIASSPRMSARRTAPDHRFSGSANSSAASLPSPSHDAASLAFVPQGSGEMRQEATAIAETSAVLGSWLPPALASAPQVTAAALFCIPPPSVVGPPATISAPTPPPPLLNGQVPLSAMNILPGATDGGTLLQLPLLGHVTFPDGRSVPVVLGPDGMPRYLIAPGSSTL